MDVVLGFCSDHSVGQRSTYSRNGQTFVEVGEGLTILMLFLEESNNCSRRDHVVPGDSGSIHNIHHARIDSTIMEVCLHVCKSGEGGSGQTHSFGCKGL